MIPDTIGVPLGTRLRRIIRHPNAWQLWTATRDFRFGTYIMLYDDGRMETITEHTEGGGPDVIRARPADRNS